MMRMSVQKPIPTTDRPKPVIILTLLVLCAGMGLFPETGHAQIDTTDFFPVREGNVWVYERCENGNCVGDDHRVEIVDTTKTEDGSILVEFDEQLIVAGLIGEVFRKDTTGQVSLKRKLSSGSDTLLKTFNPKDKIGDSWLVVGDSTDGFKATVDTIKTDTLLGIKSLQHKIRVIDFGLVSSTRTVNNSSRNQKAHNKWSGGIGISTMLFFESEPAFRLKGAFINGVLLGDTTVVERESVSTEDPPQVPRSVRLFPNYPNPFNPSTTIAFQLNRPLQVSLVIYDTMGREVDRLLSGERFASGRHQVVWNGQGLATGVYYYRLRAGQRTFSQSMLLIK